MALGDPQTIIIQHTTNNATSPPPGALNRVAGQEAYEIGAITRLWLNDGAAERLLLSSSDSDTALATQNFLKLSGGNITGPVSYTGGTVAAPNEGNSLVNKTYVDNLVASSTLFQGTWAVAANTPNIGTATKQQGYFWIATTAVPGTPENAPAGTTGIVGQSIGNGDLVYWTGSQFQVVRSGNLTETIADALYVRLAGSTMTGHLTLNADATAALHAVPLQQLEDALDDYLPLAGGTMTSNAVITLQGATSHIVVPAVGTQANTYYTDNMLVPKRYVDHAIASASFTLHVDGVSIEGDGLAAATAIHVAIVDGGTY